MGECLEWSNRAVCKTVELNLRGGSNPPSPFKRLERNSDNVMVAYHFLKWQCGFESCSEEGSSSLFYLQIYLKML